MDSATLLGGLGGYLALVLGLRDIRALVVLVVLVNHGCEILIGALATVAGVDVVLERRFKEGDLAVGKYIALEREATVLLHSVSICRCPWQACPAGEPCR
jgi:hypothetical protein